MKPAWIMGLALLTSAGSEARAGENPPATASLPAAEHLPEFGPPGPPFVPGKPIAIVGGTVIDATGAAPRAATTVLIEGHKIMRVGPVGEVAIPAGAEVIDAQGMTVMPGLINSNEHIQLNPLYPSSAADLPIVALRARWEANFQQMRQKAYVYLMQGVTSQRQTSGPWRRLLPIKKEIDAGTIPGPRLFLGAALIMSPEFFAHYTAVNRTPAAALDWLRNDFAYFVVSDPADLNVLAGADFAYWKLYLSDEKFDGKNDFTDAQIQAMIARAHALGKKVDVHAQQSNDGLRRLLKFDIDSLEHPFYPDFVIDDDIVKGFAAKGITAASLLRVMVTGTEHAMDADEFDETKFIMSMSPEDYRLLMRYRDKMRFLVNHPSQRGISIYDKGDSQSDEFGQQGPSLDDQRKDREVSRLNMRHFIENHVKLSMGTDTPAFLDFQQDDPSALEMRYMIDLGLSPMEAIIAATRNGAEMLGMGKQLGTIEAGKLADVIVVAGDPLQDIGVMKRVAIVIKDGVRYK
jgi:imidazolonepropionase-like amidohydrolase